MILLIALAAATEPAPLVVDVAGMPPQLRIIRAEAAKNGWSITCEGHSGEEDVLRLSASAGQASDKLHAFLDDPNHVGSSYWMEGFGGKPPSPTCDREPPVTNYSPATPVTALSYGDARILQRLVPIARDCGFAHPLIRALRNTDPGHDQLARNREWLVLDAGENILPRNGPMICYLQMGYRPDESANTEEPAESP